MIRSAGLLDIEQERSRQINEEGFTYAHDDAHDCDELLSAAWFYYLHATGRPATVAADGAPIGWPWEPRWWKPGTDPRRTLVKAGALCVAERERLRRRFGDAANVGRVNHTLDLIVAAIARIDAAPGDVVGLGMCREMRRP